MRYEPIPAKFYQKNRAQFAKELKQAAESGSDYSLYQY